MQQYRPGIILFIIFLIVGLICYKDYGISYDEPEQRRIGIVNYSYVFNGDDSLLRFENKTYGTGVELPLIIMEKALHLEHSREQYLARHLVSHFFFLLGCLCGYVLVLRLFKNRFLACLAFLLLALHPRIYAHSYFNTKDLPFLAIVLMVLAMIQYTFEKNKTVLYLLLGCLCGYATSVRVMGLMFADAVLVFLIIDLITAIVQKKQPLRSLANIGVFVAGFAILLYVAWPFLWHHPFDSFDYAYRRFSDNKFIGVFYKGVNYPAGETPKYYLPFWLKNTLPETLLAAGFIGIILIFISFVRRPLRFITNTQERNYGLYLACFAVPVIFVVYYHYNIYDDWRHVFYIYPCFVLICMYAIYRASQTKLKHIVNAAMIIQCAILLVFMIRSHPYEQVYFNNIISHKDEYLRKNFEFDYWGSSTKQGYDYILAHDNRPEIKVSYSHEPLYNNYLMLTEEEKKRIQLVEGGNDYDYYITNFRGHAQDFDFPATVFNAKVCNSSVVRVYKAR